LNEGGIGFQCSQWKRDCTFDVSFVELVFMASIDEEAIPLPKNFEGLIKIDK
jgi:hypothetical protein